MANEKRLIDANTLIHRVCAERDSMEINHACDIGYHNGLNMAVSMAINAPTVNAVEVVRCKDCVNYCGFEHCKNGICDVDSVSKRAVCPDDFCSYGERRTNEPEKPV